MSPDLALLVLGALYALAGFGVMELAGLQLRSAVDVIKTLGLAYVVGLVSTSMVLIALLSTGVAASIPVLLAVSITLGIGGGAVGRRLHGTREPAGSLGSSGSEGAPRTGRRGLELESAGVTIHRLELAAATALLIGLGVLLVSGLRWAKVQPLGASWDAWAMWLHKGHLLYAFGHIPTAFFTSKAYLYMHQNYPLLVPLVNAEWFHFAGFNVVTLHAQYWFIYCAELWALGYTASRRARPIVWAPLLCMLAVTPNLVFGQTSLYADIPMALFLLLAALWLGEWVGRADAQASAVAPLVIAILMLGAAANTKNEGMTGAIALIAGAWVVLLLARRRSAPLRRLALASVGFLAMVAPWQLWLAVHHVGGDIPIGKGIDPVYLIDHLNRLGPSASAFYHNAISSGWDGLVVIALVLLLVGLCVGRLRREASFFLVAAGLNVAAILWVYVISPINLTWWLATSANRTDDGFVLTIAAATFALCGQMLPAGSGGSGFAIRLRRRVAVRS
jgi:hypothetical protein